jgi:hypothetical protein
MKRLILPIILAGCLPQSPHCSEADVLEMSMYCRAKVRIECKRDAATDAVDETCPALVECSSRLDACK